MRRQTSPSTGRRYPLTMICAAYRLPRSSIYAAAGRPAGAAPPAKRGPKTVHSDKAIVHEIRATLAACPFLRQGVRHAFGDFRKDVARGLTLRCDWGPQYRARVWIHEVKWLGITLSPAYVGERECNGVVERFIRTLKEQCLYLHRFTTLADARQIIGAFIDRYNRQWLIERLGFRTPAQARAETLAPIAA